MNFDFFLCNITGSVSKIMSLSFNEFQILIHFFLAVGSIILKRLNSTID